MSHLASASLFLLLAGLPGLASPSRGGEKEEIVRAISASLPLMQSSMDTWVEEASCLSCHHQGLGSMAVSLARERGFEIDGESLERQTGMMTGLPSPGPYAAVLQGNFSENPAAALGYMLLGAGAAGVPRNDSTDAMAYDIAGGQSASGAWLSVSHRPPLEDSPVTVTAVAARALALYGPEGRAEEWEERLAAARRWLGEVQPHSGEERALRLLGLGWTGASAALRRSAAAELLGRQGEDGGWGQLDDAKSDAYATGQALVALHTFGGLSANDEPYRRGVRFLLDAQQEDGSWLVETRRRTPGLPYFESGFPHRRNQFISFAGTAWATMALLGTTGDGEPSPLLDGEGPGRNWEDDLATKAGMLPVHLAAAHGGLDELRSVLEDEPGTAAARGPGGVTPLLLAVHDVRKVELLLEHGADPRARTESGNTALTQAAWYSGAAPALERLLELGLDADAPGAEGLTPLVRACITGEPDKVRTLLAHGADVDGMLPELDVPLPGLAAINGDLPLLRLLLEEGAGGADLALGLAARAGWPELVAELLERGADPDARDPEGLTALAWAARMDHGHGRRITSLLLAAGADPALSSSGGRTPLDWAEQFDNEPVAELLRPEGQR